MFVGAVLQVHTVSLEVLPAQIVLHLALHLTNPRALQAARATRDTRKSALIRLSALACLAMLATQGQQAPALHALLASTKQ